MNQKNLPPKLLSRLFIQPTREHVTKYAVIIVLLTFSLQTIAQVTVTVTNPGNTSPAMASSYPSLAQAITDLNAVVSLTGPIQLTCSNGNETAPPGGYSITNTLGTAANTITISGAVNTIITAGLQASGNAAASYDAIFKIVGGDFITIQQFTMMENSGNTVTTAGLTNTMTEFGVLLTKTTATNGAQYNTILDNSISLNAAYVNSVGIFSSSSSTSSNTTQDASSNAGTNSYNRIYGNNISNVAYGIYFICPPITASVFETGNDIGGTTTQTGNVIVFGNANPGSGVWNRSQSTVQAGIYFRNGAGNSIRYNTVTSNSVAYSGTTGLSGIMISSVSAPVGVTYNGEISDNAISLYTTGVSLVTGIDFGNGITTGSIVSNNNRISISATQSAANTAAITGIKASYPSSTNTCNGNTILINQMFSPITNLTNSGSITAITLAGSGTSLTANNNHVVVNQTNSPASSATATLSGAVNGIVLSGAASTIEALRDTLLFNRVADMSAVATSVMSGPVSGIVATGAASVALTIGGEGNGCSIAIKETAASTGISTFSSIVSLMSINAAHNDVTIVGNTFTTADGTVRSTGNFDMILGGVASLSGLLTIKGNNASINRQALSGTVGFYTQTSVTTTDAADSISSNVINISDLAGISNAVIINRLGGLSTAARNICNNNITVGGTSSGTVSAIVCGNSSGAVISGNRITLNTAAVTTNGIIGAAGCVNAAVSNNVFSLVSSSTVSSVITAINAGVSGPYQVFQNVFESLSLTTGGGATNSMTAIAIGSGETNNVYQNRVVSMSATGSGHTGNTTITGINISGGVYTRVYANTLSGISTEGSPGNMILSGISVSGGTTNTVYGNHLFDISTMATGTSSLISGIRISGGTVDSVFNNRISGLTASHVSATDVIRGVNIVSSKPNSVIYVFYNTIFLNATSSETDFGTSGVYHLVSTTSTTAMLDMRNNIIVNTSVAKGTGVTVAYRRSQGGAGMFANYAPASNHNVLYAGTSGSVFFDGTTNAQTLVAYRSIITASGGAASMETNSFDNDPQFTGELLPTYCRINNAATPITGINADITGAVRGVMPDIGAYEFNAAVAVTPMVSNRVYCKDEVAQRLTATGSYTLLWYTTPAGGTGDTIVLPVTSMADTLIYFVADSNAVTGCVSNRAQQMVVIAAPVGNNTIDQHQTVCNGCTPAAINGSMPTGGNSPTYHYQWQSSITDSLSGFTNVAGTVLAQHYTPGALHQTTWFRRIVTSGTCKADTSLSIMIDIADSIPEPTVAVSLRTICAGSIPAPLNGSVPVGGDDSTFTYQWLSSQHPDTGYVLAQGSNTTQNYAPGALTMSTWFKRVVHSGACVYDTSEAIKITVHPVVLTNTIVAPQSIIAGAQPMLLMGSVPTGGDGVNYQYQWQIDSTGMASVFNNAGGEANTMHYAPASIMRTASYRRIVLSGACADTSQAVQIVVYPTISANTISGTQSICTGNPAGVLTGTQPAGGNNSYVYHWVSSTTSATTGYASAGGADTMLNYIPGVVFAKTWYKRIVYSTGGTDTSNAVVIAVHRTIVSNTITGNQTICSGVFPETISGQVPSGGNDSSYMYLWLTSVSGSNQGFVLAAGENTTQNYAPASVTTRTWFRRVVASGVCAADTSASVEVKIMLPIRNNIITGSHIICPGSLANTINGLMPEGGDDSAYTYVWLSSTSSADSGFMVAEGNFSSKDYIPGTLALHTWFKRIVLSGGCVTDTSLAVEVRVLMPIRNNIITGARSVCKGYLASGIIGNQPMGGNDSSYSYEWLSSTIDSVSGFVLAGGLNATSNYFPGILTTRTWFRRVVFSGGCVADTSPVLDVKVMLPVENNVVMASQIICRGSPAHTIVGSVPTGGDENVYTYQWLVSTTGGLGVYTLANGIDTTQSYQPGMVYEHSWFRRVVTSGVCASDTSSAGLVTVNDKGIWSGANSTAWNDTNNWTCPFVPDYSTNVVVQGGLPNMPLITDAQQTANLLIENGASVSLNTSASVLAVFGAFTNNGTLHNTQGRIVMAGNFLQQLPAATYHQLEINNTSGVLLSGNTIITDSLILTSGKLNLNGNHLLLANFANATSGSPLGYVATTGGGKMSIQHIGIGGKTGNIIFPVGNTRFNPVTIHNTGIADDYTVGVLDSVVDSYDGVIPVGSVITSSAVNKTWLITESVTGGSDVTLSLGWSRADEQVGFTRTSSYLSRFSGANWMRMGTGLIAGNNPYSITMSGIDSFGVFGVGSGNVLPVKLVHFSGLKYNHSVRIDWITAGRFNNEYFILQRSFDAVHFSNVTLVNGKENASNRTSYTYTDLDVPSAVLYYRLVLKDVDGNESLSNVIRIDVDDHKRMELLIAPNPFSGSTSLFINSLYDETIQLKITDAQGKVIIEKHYQLQEGANEFVLRELIMVQAGVYVVTVITRSESFQQRVVKVD